MEISQRKKTKGMKENDKQGRGGSEKRKEGDERGHTKITEVVKLEKERRTGYSRQGSRVSSYCKVKMELVRKSWQNPETRKKRDPESVRVISNWSLMVTRPQTTTDEDPVPY